MARRITVLEFAGRRIVNRYDVAQPPLDTVVTVGRRGDIVIGMNPADKGVGSEAVDIEVAYRGWRVLPRNENGVILHHWAQPSRLIQRQECPVGAWVGVQVLGRVADRQYWILLFDDTAYTVGAGITTTAEATPIKPLTGAEEQALRVVFADHLCWPPSAQLDQLKFEAAGRRLACGPDAVRARLRLARKKAAARGFHRRVDLADPAYLYALVQTGQLTPLESDLHPALRTNNW